ncbi:aldehyde dehydrogenase family protein, partial [Pseudomonas syringae]
VGSRWQFARSNKDRFLSMWIWALSAWKPGNPLDPATTVGALVDTQQMKTVLYYIEAGHSDGAKLVAGGKRILQETGGTYVEPTIIDGGNNAKKIAQEEIFGPVLSVLTFDSAEEALSIANSPQSVLSAAVSPSKLRKAHPPATALRAVGGRL